MPSFPYPCLLDTACPHSQQEYRAVLGDENAECPPLCDVYASVKGDPTDKLFNGEHYLSSAPALLRLALRRPRAQQLQKIEHFGILV